MDILVLHGSPRSATHSNSSILADSFVEQAVAQGAQATTFELNALTFRGCQACDGCRKGPGVPCVLKDDLTEVLEAVYKADILVLSSPVYFGDVSAQLKTFIDRCRAFLKPDFKTNPIPGQLVAGKQLVWVLVQGQADATTYDDIQPRYWKFFKYFNYEVCHTLRACGPYHKDDIRQDAALLESARQLAMDMV